MGNYHYLYPWKSTGLLTFAFEKVKNGFPDFSEQVVKNELFRLSAQKIIVPVYRSFYVVIPPQYAATSLRWTLWFLSLSTPIFIKGNLPGEIAFSYSYLSVIISFRPPCRYILPARAPRCPTAGTVPGRRPCKTESCLPNDSPAKYGG